MSIERYADGYPILTIIGVSVRKLADIERGRSEDQYPDFEGIDRSPKYLPS